MGRLVGRHAMYDGGSEVDVEDGVEEDSVNQDTHDQNLPCLHDLEKEQDPTVLSSCRELCLKY